MFRTLTICLWFVLTLPLTTFAQEFNAGIVQGLWYGEKVVFADTSVRIYVAIRNNTGSDLTGTVEFYDGEKRIDRKSVQTLNGRIIESWADWEPTYGTHTLKATLSRTELHKVGSSTQSVEVVSALAEDTLFADYDTDKDGTGNIDDSDDDGDDISDSQEKNDGTDPLIKNVVVAEASESSSRTSDNSDEDEAKDDSEDNSEHANTRASGVERYLQDSPAENILSTVTTHINQTKQNLDTYRNTRLQKIQARQSSSTLPAVDEGGFGKISRATDTQLPEANTASSGSKKTTVDGIINTVAHTIVALFSILYTAILSALSFVLGHPMFVQLGILVLILFLLVKFAAKFGRRPKRY